MADLFMIAFLAIHIRTAVFWASSTFLFAWFHETVVDPVDHERTLRRLADYAGMSRFIGASGVLAAITGLLLYWRVSGGLDMGGSNHPMAQRSASELWR